MHQTTPSPRPGFRPPSGGGRVSNLAQTLERSGFQPPRKPFRPAPKVPPKGLMVQSFDESGVMIDDGFVDQSGGLTSPRKGSLPVCHSDSFLGGLLPGRKGSHARGQISHAPGEFSHAPSGFSHAAGGISHASREFSHGREYSHSGGATMPQLPPQATILSELRGKLRVRNQDFGVDLDDSPVSSSRERSPALSSARGSPGPPLLRSKPGRRPPRPPTWRKPRPRSRFRSLRRSKPPATPVLLRRHSLPSIELFPSFGQRDSGYPLSGVTDSSILSESQSNFSEEEDDSDDEDMQSMVSEDQQSCSSGGTHRSTQKLASAAREFYDTELTYLATLRVLAERYPASYAKASARNPDLSDQGLAEALPRCLDQLVSLHETLAQDFGEAIQAWNPDQPGGIGRILSQKAPFLRMSADFLCKKDHFARILNELALDGPMGAVLREFERAECNRLKLVDYLNCVHQRICRYPLLLEAYLKYLPPTCPEYALAQKALKDTSEVAFQLDQRMNEDENAKQLLEIQKSILGPFKVVRPGRTLLKQGLVKKHSRKELQERMLFLFNDMLLYCSPVPATYQWSVRNAIPLGAIVRVESSQFEDMKRELYLISRERSFTFAFASTAEKDEWARALRQAIENRAKLDLLQPGGLRELEIGTVAPPWIPDNRVTSCHICNGQFTITHRRHHCRCCGVVICGKCLAYAPIAYHKYQNVKVCDPCSKAILRYALEGRTPVARTYQAYMGNIRMCKQQRSGRNYVSRPEFNGSAGGRESGAKIVRKPSQMREPDGIVIQGYIERLESKNWRKYWAVLRQERVLELYKASHDNIPVEKTVLLGQEVVERTDFEESGVIFDLRHTNQIAIGGPKSPGATGGMVQTFKVDNVSLGNQWLLNLEELVKL